MSDRERNRHDHPNHRPSPWLRELLNFPPVAGEFSALAARWRYCDITVICARPPGLRPGDWMPYAVRGATSDILFERELPQPARASAWQALFSPNHLRLSGRQVPTPLLIDVKAGLDEIIVTARLFGFADLWRDPFLGALITALNGGVSLWENSCDRRPWRVLDFSYVEHLHTLEMPGRPDFRICAHTPICYGAQAHMSDEPERFVLSALGRVALLARWQDFLLDFTIPDLGELRRRCMVRKGMQGRKSVLHKHSRNHPGHALELRGETTELLVSVPVRDWAAALALSTTCGAGGHVAYGFGRFVIKSHRKYERETLQNISLRVNDHPNPNAL